MTDTQRSAGDGTLEFQRTLPAKRMAAGLLLRDAASRVLLVEPSYKRDWEIPGGAVDDGESPRDCVAREVREELGITIVPGPLVVVEHQRATTDRTESVMFVFDGGLLDTALLDRFTLAADELLSWRFVATDELDSFANERLSRRIRAALQVVVASSSDCHPAAWASPTAVYLEDGQPAS